MKMLALIISIFLFTASVFPCADVCEDIGIICATHTNKQSNPTQDQCPIFCICNCCGVVTENIVSAPNVSSPFVFKASFGSLLINEHPSGYNTSVWQPPKQA